MSTREQGESMSDAEYQISDRLTATLWDHGQMRLVLQRDRRSDVHINMTAGQIGRLLAVMAEAWT